MFTESVNRAYDLTDATWEIIVMLLGAFVLGYLLRHFLDFGFGISSMQKVEMARPAKFLTFKENDLKIVEGIGPKIDELLKKNGITTWTQLGEASPEKLRSILQKGGDRFAMHEPRTWPDQARLAAKGEWQALEDFQNILVGGK